MSAINQNQISSQPMDRKNKLVVEINNEVLLNYEILKQDQKKNENNTFLNKQDLTLKSYFEIEEINTQIKEQYGKNYRLKEFIDEGGEGQIFGGTILDDQGVENECVFKIYQCKEEDEFIEEKDIMKSFECPINVIKPIDFIKINIKEVRIYILVLEKCKQSLKDELNMFKNQEKNFSFDILLKIIFDLLDGLIQLRMYRILHLDIKPSNILINKDGDYIITDFGLSSKIGTIKNKGFTPKYSPIEQIEQKQLDFKSDVFSLGKTLSEIIEIFKTTNQNLLGSIGTILQKFEEIIKNRMQNDIVSERDECQNLHELFFELINTSEFIEFHYKYIHRINQIIELFPFDQNKDITFFQNQILYYSIKKLQLQQILHKNQNQKQYFLEDLSQTNQFDISASLNTVGLCYQEIGNKKKALKYLLESLELKKSFYQGDHLNVALSLNNVGACYQKFRDTYYAQQYLLQSLKMKQQIYNENNLDVALSLNNIGSCYKKHGEFQNALIYILESIKITKQMFNESHPYIAVSLNNASECYQILEDKELAIKYRSQSIEMKKQILQGNNSSTTYSFYDHRLYHNDIKQKQSNPKYELQCLEMSKYLFQENNPDIIFFPYSFGAFYFQLFYSQNFLKYLQQKLEMIKQQYQFYHPDIIFFLNKIGSCYMDMSEPQIALKYFQECDQKIKHQFQENHPKIIESQSNIEECQNLIKQIKMSAINQNQISLQPMDRKNKLVVEILKQDQKKNENNTFLKQDLTLKSYIEIKEINTQIKEQYGKNYRLKEFIDEGGEGQIFGGTILDDQGVENECVFKICQCKEEDEFIEEKDIMKSFECPINVIKIIDFIKINIKEVRIYILVLEKCKQSLKDELNMFKNQEKNFSFDILLKIIFDLLDGLIQLRVYRILHLDIKPSNILINKNDDYVITDFELSSMIGTIKNKGFTSKYSPIEQIEYKQLDFKSDVFSLGKTLNETIDTFKTVNQNLQGNIGTIVKKFEDIIQNRMQNDIVSERDECQKLHKLFFQLINSSEFIQFHFKYIHRINQIIELFPYDQKKDITFFQKQILHYTIKKLQLQQIFYKYKNQKQNFFEVLSETNLFDISASLNTVGLCYQEIGNQKKALKYLLESLELKKTFYLGDHLNIALSLNSIGACYQKFGETYFALKYLLQSLEMKQQIFQENNLDISLSLNNIGSCYKKHGDYKNALKYILESINMTKQMFNESHPYIAVSLRNVSECYENLENKEFANKYRIQSVEMKKQLLQENNSSITISLYDHREYHHDIKLQQINPKYGLQCLEMSKYLFQENNLDIISFQISFGIFYYYLFFSQNYLKYLQLRLEMIKQQYQSYHPDIIFFLNKIGSCHIDMGEPQIGLKYFQECHEMIQHQFQENDPKTIVSQSNIEECYNLKWLVLTHQISSTFFYFLKFKILSFKITTFSFLGVKQMILLNILFFYEIIKYLKRSKWIKIRTQNKQDILNSINMLVISFMILTNYQSISYINLTQLFCNNLQLQNLFYNLLD